ncbi:unnamed protein product, partial [Adineta steineri]
MLQTRNFPALINNTTIDYFARWPQQALYAVAEHFISDFKLITNEFKNNIIEHMIMVHESANFYCDLYTEKMHRSAYATPKNYLDFIHTFIQLYKQKKDDLLKQAERLNVGIIRIDEASILIQEMDKKLEKQRKELAIKTQKCDDLLSEITILTAKQTERKSRSLIHFRNILDNNELIETLENTKTKVSEVIQALNLGERTRQDIEKLRDTYRLAARRGAVLYFSLVQMSTINSMYQYSLNSFLSVFEYSVKSSQTNFKLEKRLQSIVNTLTYQIYCYGTIGMFEKHKLLYSFLLTIQIELDKQIITYNQIDFFLKGNLSLDKSSKPLFNWLTYETWHHCLYLSKQFPEKFQNLIINIEEHPTEWKQWAEHDQLENIALPKPFDTLLNDFEKLMLIRCFSPNRIIFAINKYITKIMGEKYIIPPTVYFDSIFEQSTAQIPVIFILSPGSDPTNDIQKLAERKNQIRKIPTENGLTNEEQKTIRTLAMGQGQEKLALQSLIHFRNILDNNELIETLENTKTKVSEVIQALNLGERTRQDIEKLRDTYRLAARRGAVLYFSLVQMSTINSMYQYSLNSFLSVFEYSVKSSQTNFKLEKRLQSIVNTLTYQIYCYGTIGMFEKHKLLYSFLLTIQIELDKQIITYNQIDFFLKGNLSLDKSSKPLFSWLTYETWHHCLYLSKQFPEKFQNLILNIEENPIEWKQWAEHDQPENIALPKPFDILLNDFEKLMLIRCFSPNRIIFAINKYITKIMGEKYIIPPTAYFDSIFEQSKCHIPVIFILSPGSDPTNDIQKLAERKNQIRKTPTENGLANEEQKTIRTLAMGQGQEKLALQVLHTAQHQGTWLLLQNCHLLLPFLNE